MNPFTSICVVKDSHTIVVAKYFAKITHLFLQCISLEFYIVFDSVTTHLDTNIKLISSKSFLNPHLQFTNTKWEGGKAREI